MYSDRRAGRTPRSLRFGSAESAAEAVRGSTRDKRVIVGGNILGYGEPVEVELRPGQSLNSTILLLWEVGTLVYSLEDNNTREDRYRRLGAFESCRCIETCTEVSADISNRDCYLWSGLTRGKTCNCHARSSKCHQQPYWALSISSSKVDVGSPMELSSNFSERSITAPV